MKPIGPEYYQSRVASLSSVRRNKPVDSPVGHSHRGRNLSIAIEPRLLLGAGLNCVMNTPSQQTRNSPIQNPTFDWQY